MPLTPETQAAISDDLPRLRALRVYLGMDWEVEIVPRGVEINLEEEVARSYDGWRLGGHVCERHWVRAKPQVYPERQHP
jgi:hypothetical protein